MGWFFGHKRSTYTQVNTVIFKTNLANAKVSTINGQEIQRYILVALNSCKFTSNWKDDNCWFMRVSLGLRVLCERSKKCCEFFFVQKAEVSVALNNYSMYLVKRAP